MPVHFVRIYPDVRELLVSHLERSLVINDINQENEKLTEDRSNEMLHFQKLEVYM